MGDGSARGETRRARDSGDGTCAPTPSDAPDAPAACAPAHGKHPVSDDDDWATPPPDGDERSDDDDTTIGAVATRFVGPGRRAAVLESETDTPSFRVNDLRSPDESLTQEQRSDDMSHEQHDVIMSTPISSTAAAHGATRTYSISTSPASRAMLPTPASAQLIGAISDPDVAATTADLANSRHRTSTMETNKRHVQTYWLNNDFVRNEGIDVNAPSAEQVAGWIASLAMTGRHGYDSIRTYKYALKAHLQEQGLTNADVCESEIVKRTLDGLRNRQLVNEKADKTAPIPPDYMLKLLNTATEVAVSFAQREFKLNRDCASRDQDVRALTNDGVLHPDTFYDSDAGIKIKEIREFRDSVVVIVTYSFLLRGGTTYRLYAPDLGRRGDIFLDDAGNLSVSVREMKNRPSDIVNSELPRIFPKGVAGNKLSVLFATYMKIRQQLNKSLGYVSMPAHFPILPGETGFFDEKNYAQKVDFALKRVLKRWPLPVTAGLKYTAHSLRRGGATALAAIGVPVHVIKWFGFWKPTSQVCENTYVSVGHMLHSGVEYKRAAHEIFGAFVHALGVGGVLDTPETAHYESLEVLGSPTRGMIGRPNEDFLISAAHHEVERIEQFHETRDIMVAIATRGAELARNIEALIANVFRDEHWKDNVVRVYRNRLIPAAVRALPPATPPPPPFESPSPSPQPSPRQVAPSPAPAARTTMVPSQSPGATAATPQSSRKRPRDEPGFLAPSKKQVAALRNMGVDTRALGVDDLEDLDAQMATRIIGKQIDQIRSARKEPPLSKAPRWMFLTKAVLEETRVKFAWNHAAGSITGKQIEALKKFDAHPEEFKFNNWYEASSYQAHLMIQCCLLASKDARWKRTGVLTERGDADSSWMPQSLGRPPQRLSLPSQAGPAPPSPGSSWGAGSSPASRSDSW